MSSSHTISLFSERPDLKQAPSSFFASAVAHGAATGILSLGILYAPPNEHRALAPHYAVRQLDMHTADQPEQRASGGVPYPGPHTDSPQPSAGGKPEAQSMTPRQTAEAEKGPQTLLQPDILRPLHLKEDVKVPTVAIWTPKKETVKLIVAPKPEPATAADVKPSVIAPNPELNLADLSIASAQAPLNPKALPPGTTSPVVVHGPERVQMAPVTTSQTKAEPTPTAVLSLSDVHMPEGHVTLPPVNETTAKTGPGLPAPGPAGDLSRKGVGNQASHAGGAGAGMAAGESVAPGNAAAQQPAGSSIWPAQGKQAGEGDGGAETSAHFTLPRDGQFGAVIVGASLQDQFPEIGQVWNDRMAYTVYLHVGLRKSWILQYSLPPASEAAAGGNISRLEAPWPYNIVRPNLAAGSINADALMVHGFVNQAGRFEGLAVAFPAEFAQAQYVLGALAQWQFRPAARNGQPEKVEVVLIIPEEEE
jgi:hypothetical protein